MNNSSSISIIIPAYNATATLEKAVNSVTEQIDAQIIIVENGSTDGTYELAKELAEKDKRIVVLQSEKGVSNARNKGIDAADGEWIAFLDADDYYLENAFRIVLKYLDSDSDLVTFGHRQVVSTEHSSGTKIPKVKKEVSVTNKNREYSGEKLENAQILMLENPTTYLTAFAKLFRKSVITDNRLYFDNEMSVAEDSDFVVRFLLRCRSIFLAKELIYDYTIDNVSTMRSYDTDRIKKFLLAFNKTSNNIKSASSSIRKAFSRYVLLNVNIMMVHGPFSKGNPATFFTKLILMKKVSEVKVVRESLQQLTLADLKNIRMIPIFLIKYGFCLSAACIFHFRAVYNDRFIDEGSR